MNTVTFCFCYTVAILALAPYLVTGSGHASASSISADLPVIDCTLDDDSTNPTLEYCFSLGAEFAEKYEKYLKKGKKFDRCPEFQQFQDCLRPLLNTCPLISKTLDRKWRNIYEVMTCVCGNSDGSSPDCVQDLECLETEHSSIYMSLCQELYDFNIVQDTHGKCRFMREKLDCEGSLVASACGEPVSQFYTSLVKVLPKKLKCYAPAHSYHFRGEGFRYTPQCPRNITEKIQKCSLLHPVESVLHFHEDNDLVVVDTRKELKQSCSSFVKYQECFDDVREQCPDGVSRILDYNGNLRSYMMKMDYICNDARRPYLESMYCYQNIMTNDTFSKCNHVWEDVTDNLFNLTSYQYYCQPQDPRSRDMRLSLKELERCYEEVLNLQCGVEAGNTMARLISIAFKDPYYLRYAFKPDCKLHNPEAPQTTPPTVPPSTTTTPTTTQRRHFRPSSHNPTHIVNKPDKVVSNSNANSIATRHCYSLVFISIMAMSLNSFSIRFS